MMAKSKVTLGQIEPLAQAVNGAMAQADSYGTRFKLREVLRSLATHGQDLDAEKQALVQEYAVKDDDDKPVIKDNSFDFGDKQDEVDRRWRELIGTQVVIQHKLTLEDVAGLPADPALDALELLLG
jgi:hypothetical protein